MVFGRMLPQILIFTEKWQLWGKEVAHEENAADITPMLLDKKMG